MTLLYPVQSPDSVGSALISPSTPALRSSDSAEALAPLFAAFIAVGSEEAPGRASLPSAAQTARTVFPQAAFTQVSHRKIQGRNQCNETYQPVFANQPALRELFPARVAPALVTMRPDASHDPAVKLVEESADMGPTVVGGPNLESPGSAGQPTPACSQVPCGVCACGFGP